MVPSLAAAGLVEACGVGVDEDAVGAVASGAAGAVGTVGAGVGCNAANSVGVTISTATGCGGGTTSCRSGEASSTASASPACRATDAIVPQGRRRSLGGAAKTLS